MGALRRKLLRILSRRGRLSNVEARAYAGVKSNEEVVEWQSQSCRRCGKDRSARPDPVRWNLASANPRVLAVAVAGRCAPILRPVAECACTHCAARMRVVGMGEGEAASAGTGAIRANLLARGCERRWVSLAATCSTHSAMKGGRPSSISNNSSH
jgi:hypothetical protein